MVNPRSRFPRDTYRRQLTSFIPSPPPLSPRNPLRLTHVLGSHTKHFLVPSRTTALLVTDDYQRKYLSVKDFLTSGLPMSLASVGMICTLGYLLIVEIIIPGVVLGGNDDDSFKQASSGR